MFKYILRQIKRSAVLNAIFCLLLMLAGTLLSLGAGLLMTADRSSNNIEAEFTTIAMPDESEIRKHAISKIEQEGITEYDAGYAILTPDNPFHGNFFNQYVADHITDETLRTIEEDVYNSDAVQMDTRRYFGAYSAQVVPVTGSAYSTANSSAAFIATCDRIEEMQQITIDTDDETGEWRYVVSTNAVVQFKVEETLVLHPDIKPPDAFTVDVRFIDEDGGWFFTVGDRYFISGTNYSVNPQPMPGSIMETMANSKLDVNLGIGDAPADPVKKGLALTFEDLSGDLRNMMGSGFYWYDVTNDDYPLDIIAYRQTDETYLPWQYKLWFKLEKDFPDTLDAENGDDIRFAIDVADKSAYSFNVLTTGNLNSYFRFNQHRAYVEQGRSFTAIDLSSGARVCLVPSALAEKNGLSIGDTVTLRIFESRFYQTRTYYPDNPNRDYRSWLPMGMYIPGMAESGPIDFEIIGIYHTQHSSGMSSGDHHAIPVNTVIIPDKSFDGFPAAQEDGAFSEVLRGDSNPLMNTIIVPNGKNDEFRESINALIPGYGNFFRLYDQGYSFVKSALDNLKGNALMIFWLCLAGWLISVIVFCLFFALRKKKEAGLLFAIGVGKKNRFSWVFMQCAIVIIIAQAASLGASMQFYGGIVEYAVEAAESGVPAGSGAFSDTAVAEDGAMQEFAVTPVGFAVPASAAVQTFALLMLAGCFSAAVSRRSLLREKR